MNLAKLLLASAKSLSTPADVNFKYVSMLLHGDGASGGQNNSFSATDASSTNYTLTRNGSLTSGSFSPYGSNWSVYQSSTATSYQTYGASTSASPGSQDLCIEAWVRFDAMPTTQGTSGGFTLWQKGRTGTSNFELACAVILDASGSGGFQMSYQVSSNGTGAVSVNSANISGLTVGTWNHLAFTQASGSGVVKYWFNGASAGSSNHGVTTIFSGSAAVGVGNNNAGGNAAWSGNISNLRVVYGSQVYTSAFTPSTTPLTAITGTNFLSCQSNRFIDNSSNAWTLTQTGTLFTQKLNPFGDSATPYVTSTYGGAIFQGSGSNDFLTGGPSLTLSGDFTIEGWVYYIGTGMTLVSQWISGNNSSSSYSFGVRSNGSNTLFLVYGQGSTVTQLNGSSVAVNVGAWNHVAVTRSGSTVRFFVNGVLDTATSTVSGALNGSTATQNVGSQNGNASTTIQYISDVRIVNGTALHTTTFAPPTAPLTAVTNTGFLFHGTDAAIFDNAMQQTLLTAGNAKISTTTVKFGTGSMSFDGSSSSYIQVPYYEVPALRSTNWTIEGWIYPTATGGGILAQGTTGGSNAVIAISFASGGNTVHVQGSTNGTSYTLDFTTSTSLSLNTWTHLAVVNNGGTVTCYIGGVSSGSASFTGSLKASAAPLIIGSTSNSSGTTMTGFIDELRISYGVARYTANFAPPTSAFQDQ